MNQTGVDTPVSNHDLYANPGLRTRLLVREECLESDFKILRHGFDELDESCEARVFSRDGWKGFWCSEPWLRRGLPFCFGEEFELICSELREDQMIRGEELSECGEVLRADED